MGQLFDRSVDRVHLVQEIPLVTGVIAGSVALVQSDIFAASSSRMSSALAFEWDDVKFAAADWAQTHDSIRMTNIGRQNVKAISLLIDSIFLLSKLTRDEELRCANL